MVSSVQNSQFIISSAGNWEVAILKLWIDHT